MARRFKPHRSKSSASTTALTLAPTTRWPLVRSTPLYRTNGQRVGANDIKIDLTPRPEPYVISFAITTVDRDGLESALSETVSKTFDVDSTADPAAPTSLQFTINCVDGCSVTEVTGE